VDNDSRSWGQRHPRRKSGLAFIAGSALGAGIVAKKMRNDNKYNLQKILRRLGM
jgi:hypothetical protein